MENNLVASILDTVLQIKIPYESKRKCLKWNKKYKRN